MISTNFVSPSTLVFAPVQVYFLKVKSYLPAFLIPLQSLGFRCFLDHPRYVSVLGDATDLGQVFVSGKDKGDNGDNGDNNAQTV